MNVISFADRPKLACAEHPSGSRRSGRSVHDLGVMTRLLKELFAAAVARKHQRRLCLVTGNRPNEIVRGARRVAYVELQGGSNLDLRADRECAGLLIRTEHVSDEKVAGLMVMALLIDHHTYM